MQSTSLFLFSEVCFVRDWTDNWGLNVCQSPAPWAGQGKWPSLSSFAWRCSFGLFNGDRPIDGIGGPTIFVFTLEELGYEEPATEAGRALAWPFFWFENNFCQSKWSKKKRKASKHQSSSDRWIEESRNWKSPWAVLQYTRTWVRSIKRRAAPAARSTGRRPPRDRSCEMTFETEGRDRRERQTKERERGNEEWDYQWLRIGGHLIYSWKFQNTIQLLHAFDSWKAHTKMYP